jgi:hypothetical protein
MPEMNHRRPQLRAIPVPPPRKELVLTSSRIPVRQPNLEPNTSLHHTNLTWTDHHMSKLGLDIQTTKLGNNHHVPIRVDNRTIGHRGVGGVDVDSEAFRKCGIPGTGECFESGEKVDFGVAGWEGEWAPCCTWTWTY